MNESNKNIRFLFKISNLLSYHNIFEITSKCRKIKDGSFKFKDQSIKQQKNKVFSIVETNTIIQPRTMMIHIQDTSVTSRTMMTSFWLENVANQTISSCFGISIINKETLWKNYWKFYHDFFFVIPKTKELFRDLSKLFGNMISKTKPKSHALQWGEPSDQLILNGKNVF